MLTADKIQDMGEYHLSHGGGTVCRDIGNDNSAFAGCVDVYDVISGSQYSDIFQIG